MDDFPNEQKSPEDFLEPSDEVTGAFEPEPASNFMKKKLAEDLLSRKTRNWYQCRRCRYHGQFVFLAGGHYQVCPFRNCACQACRYVSKDTERAGQRMREWRKTKKERQRVSKSHLGSMRTTSQLNKTKKRHAEPGIELTKEPDSPPSHQATVTVQPILPQLYHSPPSQPTTPSAAEHFPLDFTATVPPQRSFVQVLPTVTAPTPPATAGVAANRQLFVQSLLALPPQAPLAEQRRQQEASRAAAQPQPEIKEESVSPDLHQSAQQSEDSDVQESSESMYSGSRRTENQSASAADHVPFCLTNIDCLVNLLNLAQEVRNTSFVLRSDGEVRFVSESEEKSLRLVDLGHMIRITVEAPPKRTDSEWPKFGGWEAFETFVRTLLITLCDICSSTQ